MKQIVIESPVGDLRLISDGEALTGIHFAGHGPTSGIEPASSGDPLLTDAARQLNEWFTGQRRRFELPLAPRGTEFQRAVWRALVEVEFGEHCSYADIARAVGKPTASRAVGAANGRNPIAIVIPCHRVIGASGALTGYGGGLDRKAWLLAHERRVSGRFGRERGRSGDGLVALRHDALEPLEPRANRVPDAALRGA